LGMNFRDLYDAQFPFVYRTLCRFGLAQPDAVEAAQEVFLVVHRRLGEFEGRARLTTWLFRICYRVARDRRRKAHLRHEVLDSGATESEACTTASADVAFERQQDLQLLDSALAALDLEQRAVFTLFELEEMTGEDIAETLEIPLGTVYSRLRLARAAFQKSIRRELAKRASPVRPSEKVG
jgi:RNA polymerase sigma-70 factor (ECF subfamily)